MRYFKRALAGLVLYAAAAAAGALTIADSVSGFSTTQGTNGWSYGFFDAGPAPGAGYTPASFVAFDTFNAIDARWEASAAQVSVDNNVYLSVDANGGHPNGIGPDDQDSIIWALRRYTSATAGLFDLSYDLHKRNISNPNGSGITGHIFVDGVERFVQIVANANGVGFQGTFAVQLNAGSFIDLAIASTGFPSLRDPSPHNARADGTDFSALLGTHVAAVPEPSEMAFMLAGLGVVAWMGARRRRRAA